MYKQNMALNMSIMEFLPMAHVSEIASSFISVICGAF